MNVEQLNGLIPPCLERPLHIAGKPIAKYILTLLTTEPDKPPVMASMQFYRSGGEK